MVIEIDEVNELASSTTTVCVPDDKPVNTPVVF